MLARRDLLKGWGAAFLGATAIALLSAPLAVADDDLAKKLLAAPPPLGEKSLGSPDAPAVLIEYASATCPHCAHFHVDVLPELKKTYIETGKLRLVFREFPTDQRALAVFMLARCVPDDRYFEAIDAIFREQKEWNAPGADTKGKLFGMFGALGLTSEAAEACLKREDLARSIHEYGQSANKDFGVKSTPTLFVNGIFVDGHDDAEPVREAIDAALKK
jgi:protein-disulfide isomerase